MTIKSANRAGLTVSGSSVWEGPGRGGGEPVARAPWLSATPHPCSYAKMMGCGESELMSVEGEEAVAAPTSPPEPRAPEPGVPVPEPGLDLSLSPSPPSESPEQPNCSPGRWKGREDRRGGARKGRQVRWCKAWPAARHGPTPTSSLPCSLLLGPLPPGAALPSRVGEGAGRRHTEREALSAAGPRGSCAAEQLGPESRVAGCAGRSRGPVRCHKGRGGTAEKVVPDPLWPGGERGGG